MEYLLVAAAAYLIGAFPSAYLIVRLLTGRDLRTLGTGNVGVMNTARQAGLPAAMLAFLGEGAKGIAALGIARWRIGSPEADCLAAIMAMVGVNWSVFMGFAGGRGTTIAVFIALALLWPVVVVLGLVWLVVYRFTHDNFVATRVNIILLPFVSAAVIWLTGASWTYVSLAVVGSLVALLKHKRATDDHFVAATAHARAK